jgi:hypothetical protein
MSTATRVLAALAGLAVVFGAAWWVGRSLDPFVTAADSHGHATATDAAQHGDEGHGGSGQQAGEHAAGGTGGAVTLAVAGRELEPGPDAVVAFSLRGPDGAPLTTYDVKHEKRLHLVLLDTRTLVDYQHVHPQRTGPSSWSARVPLTPGTTYKLFADGSTGGTGFVATAEVFTSGHHPPSPQLPAPARHASVEGYDVALATEDGAARLSVTRDGGPAALQPYLGALGHLVVVRVDDLAYLHVHPESGEAPTFRVGDLVPGRYRYFFDFRADGRVHTAAFTVAVTSTGEGGHEHGH